ncbi:MAG: hypothetical protein ACYC6Y_28640 [Thermoguttaceae bacterium]
MNLRRINLTFDDYLESLWGFTRHDGSERSSRRHFLMRLIVVSNQHQFGIINPEVDTDYLPRARAFEFTEPLVRHIKVPCDRHCEYATLTVVQFSQTSNAVAANVLGSRLRRQMNEHRHSSYRLRKTSIQEQCGDPIGGMDAALDYESCEVGCRVCVFGAELVISRIVMGGCVTAKEFSAW